MSEDELIREVLRLAPELTVKPEDKKITLLKKPLFTALLTPSSLVRQSRPRQRRP